MEQVNIQIPEGYVIDTEKSNFEEGKIIFKEKEQPSWRNNKCAMLSGYFVTSDAYIEESGPLYNVSSAWNVFATKKQAQSMLAMAQLSQIIANDDRFGGPITDAEWNDNCIAKYVIVRSSNELRNDYLVQHYHFLAFHTKKQRELFIKENEDLIKQYYMLD